MAKAAARDGLRDAALIAVMSECMLRVLEAAALTVFDIEADGRETVTFRQSKTDQEGRGTVLGVRRGTVRRLRRWLAEAGIEGGPVFRKIGQPGTAADARQTPSRRPVSRISCGPGPRPSVSRRTCGAIR